jgi:tRNA-dihydrouridine synthase
MLINAVIFQIGTSDPELAVEAARTVQQDVSGMQVSPSVEPSIR